MRICIDASSLLMRSAGVKNYVYHWMSSLRDELPPGSVTAFPLIGEIGQLDHERSLFSRAGTFPRLLLLELSKRLPIADILTAGADVFHASSQIAIPPRRPKLTATVYDMTTALLPEVHTPANVQAEARFQQAVLKRADGLIAISESSKKDAVQVLGLDERRIAVIYPGIDQRFFHARPTSRKKPYVLFVGTIEPRKNVDTLLDAWIQLPEELRRGFDLVLAGPRGWSSDRTIARLTSGTPGIEYLDYVPEGELPSLTAGAVAFVYVSLYEGFGFPLAQAMAAGVPCITSNVSSLPEVAGDAAVLADPRSTAELSQAIIRLLESESLRAQMGRAAREKAKEFTWKNAAVQSAEFFQRVCGSSIRTGA